MKVLQYHTLVNGRDIGGMKTKDNHKIKEGRLYRSGCLFEASEEDKKLLQSLHLTDVVDLREASAFESKPDYKIDGVNYHNFPPFNLKISKNDDYNEDFMKKMLDCGGGHNFMVNLYKNMFSTNQALEAYSSFFKVLIESNDKVVLWHCAQGKDRAGMASFLLEYALGVPYEDCVNDYLLSRIAMDEYINIATPFVREHFKSEEAVKAFQDAYTVKRDYLESAVNYLTSAYGSLEDFLTNALKVNIQRLKDIYLE